MLQTKLLAGCNVIEFECLCDVRATWMHTTFKIKKQIQMILLIYNIDSFGFDGQLDQESQSVEFKIQDVIFLVPSSNFISTYTMGSPIK